MTEPPVEAPAAPAAQGGPDRWLDLLLGGSAAVILFFLMLVTFVDVVGREALAAPLPGGFEITEIMMGALIFTALPVVSRREEHVVIDLLDGIMPRGVARPRGVVVNLTSALVLGVVAWQTWTLAAQLGAYRDVTEVLELPVAPIVYLISVMSGLTTLTLIANAWRDARGPGARRPAPPSA